MRTYSSQIWIETTSKTAKDIFQMFSSQKIPRLKLK